MRTTPARRRGIRASRVPAGLGNPPLGTGTAFPRSPPLGVGGWRFLLALLLALYKQCKNLSAQNSRLWARNSRLLAQNSRLTGEIRGASGAGRGGSVCGFGHRSEPNPASSTRRSETRKAEIHRRSGRLSGGPARRVFEFDGERCTRCIPSRRRVLEWSFSKLCSYRRDDRPACATAVWSRHRRLANLVTSEVALPVAWGIPIPSDGGCPGGA